MAEQFPPYSDGNNQVNVTVTQQVTPPDPDKSLGKSMLMKVALASVLVAALVISNVNLGWPRGITLAMSALVAGLTVGGKAIGKGFAMKSATSVVYSVGRILYTLRNIPALFRKKKNKR